jgi:hypothetical protein
VSAPGKLPLGEPLEWTPVEPPTRVVLRGAHVLVRPVDAARDAEHPVCLTGAHTGAHQPLKRETPRRYGAKRHTANGIRTRVTAVRGRRPSPLDDGGQYERFEASKAMPHIPAGGGRRRGRAGAISSPLTARMWRNW